VATTLNPKAIIGLDFLQSNGCVINLDQKVMHLQGKAITLKKDAPSVPKGESVSIVKLYDSQVIPARSGIEILTEVACSGDSCSD